MPVVRKRRRAEDAVIHSLEEIMIIRPLLTIVPKRRVTTIEIEQRRAAVVMKHRLKKTPAQRRLAEAKRRRTVAVLTHSVEETMTMRPLVTAVANRPVKTIVVKHRLTRNTIERRLVEVSHRRVPIVAKDGSGKIMVTRPSANAVAKRQIKTIELRSPPKLITNVKVSLTIEVQDPFETATIKHRLKILAFTCQSKRKRSKSMHSLSVRMRPV